MKSLLLIFLCGVSLLSLPAAALEILPYSAEAFGQARAANRPIALQFHSGWCPICVMQERGVKALQDDPQLKQVVVFQADFGKEDTLRKRFNVTSFSTLIFFKGESERARTTGDFQPEKLKPLFALVL